MKKLIKTKERESKKEVKIGEKKYELGESREEIVVVLLVLLYYEKLKFSLYILLFSSLKKIFRRFEIPKLDHNVLFSIKKLTFKKINS